MRDPKILGDILMIMFLVFVAMCIAKVGVIWFG